MPLKDCLKRANKVGGASVAGGADGVGGMVPATVDGGTTADGEALEANFFFLLMVLRAIMTVKTIMIMANITLQMTMVISHALLFLLTTTPSLMTRVLGGSIFGPIN